MPSNRYTLEETPQHGFMFGGMGRDGGWFPPIRLPGGLWVVACGVSQQNMLQCLNVQHDDIVK